MLIFFLVFVPETFWRRVYIFKFKVGPSWVRDVRNLLDATHVSVIGDLDDFQIEFATNRLLRLLFIFNRRTIYFKSCDLCSKVLPRE